IIYPHRIIKGLNITFTKSKNALFIVHLRDIINICEWQLKIASTISFYLNSCRFLQILVQQIENRKCPLQQRQLLHIWDHLLDKNQQTNHEPSLHYLK